ncbi:hypothetical protein [Flavihumibacter fluvii]|uniref:hypothetical protein n=1 Tax=Flavihumibacter fluvii TaxID=2838157 RepID=UPI001BDE9F30|nr:hypothetical protein [Flavihumibacter fluvii]ULQ51701.1 hypothetical protein KJS93_16555 [Flavihumibacter fluvii]
MTNRGRFQAQGNGVQKSSAWTTDNTIYKHDGHIHINNVEGQLTNPELAERNLALQKARNFVNAAPNEGVTPLKKTFKNSPLHRSVRVDVEVIAGFAFVTPNLPDNG